MKKIFSVLLILVLLLSMAISVSALGNTVTCKVDSNTVKAGETIEVTVSMAGSEPYASIGLTFQYNTSAFSVESGKWVAQGAVITDFDVATNRGVAAFSTAEARTGEIFKLVLKANANAPVGTYSLLVEPKMKNGTLEVSAAATKIDFNVEEGSASDSSSNVQSSDQQGGHTHNYGDFIVDLQPDCTEPGVKSRHCSECNQRSEITSIEPKGHDWSDWTVVTEATTDTVGKKTRTCKRVDCGEVQNAEIAKLSADGHEHSYTDWEITKPATCTEKGEASRACTICNEKEKMDVVSTGHKYGNWSIKQLPTVDEEGVMECVCSTCSAVKTQKIDKLSKVEYNSESSDTIIMVVIILFAVAVVIIVAGMIILAVRRGRRDE